MIESVNCDNSLAELAKNAFQKCQVGVVHNFVLRGSFPYSETESAFVMNFDEVASEWQAASKPNELFINHGQYIHRHGNGLAYLVEQLRIKNDSNRACISLIDMEDIIPSRDDPIPSFLVLQFGFPQADRTRLLVTAYFRALEVASFLPINIAEISQIIRFLKLHFVEIREFTLTVIAFKAYAKQSFHCLRKAHIDCVSRDLIAHAVKEKKLYQIRDWFDSKINVEESVICTDGLQNLYDALEMYKTDYEGELLVHLKKAINMMAQLKQMRVSCSLNPTLNDVEGRIRQKLLSAKELLC